MKTKPTYQQLEKQLEEQLENLQTINNLVEKSPIIRFIWRNEKTWPVEFVSENVKSILGYTKDDFLTGKVIFSEIIHPDDLQRVESEVSKKSETILNSFTHKPYRIISKTDKIKWINDITIIRRDENNEITHYEGVIVDITEQKEAEESLIQSELRWKFAIEGNSDGLWDWNLLTNEVFFSEQWKNMLGFAKDEIKGSIEEWEKRVHPDDKKKVYEDINKHISGETDFYQNEHRVLCKDNTYKWILDRGKVISYTSDKKPARMIGTHTDISERKKAEVIYQTTVNSLRQPLHVIDKDYNIIFINKAFLDLLKELGLSQNVVGKKVYDAFNIPFDKIKKELEEVFNSGKKLVSEEVTEIKGNKIYTITTKTPIIENGKVEKIITTISNITEQKIQKQALIQRDTYISALNKATSLLLQDNSIPYQKFTEIIGKAANASRTYIFINHKDKKCNVLMSQKAEYCAKGINPEINNPNLQNLSYDNFDRMRETLSKGKLYKGRIKDFPKNEKEFLEPQDIKTILIIPIIINKQFWGFIGFDNCINEQEWTLTEQKYLETAAKNLEQEIKRNNTQKQLKAENQRFQTTMDAIDAIVYVADVETYKLLYLNKLGKELAGDNVGQKCYSALQRGLTKPCEFCTNHLLTDKNGNPKEPYVWEFQNTKTKQWYQCRDQVITWVDGRLVRIEIATDISDRKKAEISLLESEKNFRELFEKSGDAIFILENGKFTDCNQATLKMFKYNFKQQLFNLHPSELSPKKQSDGRKSTKKADEMMQTCIKKGTNRFEWDHIDSKGKILKTEVFLTAISNKKESKKIHAVVRDISIRKKTELALKKSEEKYKYLVENQGEGVGIVNLKEEFTFVNSAAEKLFGFSKGKLIGRNLNEFFDVQQFKIIRKQTEKRKQNQSSSYELVLSLNNNKKKNIFISATPEYNDKGKVIGTHAIFWDVTKQKKVEKALKASEQKYKLLSNQFRLMSDNIPDLVWAKDLDNKYTFVNNAMCEKLLIAENTKEPIGKSDMFFVNRQRNLYPERNDWHTFGEVCMNTDDIVLKTKKPQRFDEYGNIKGEFLFLDAYKAPIFDDAGEMIGTVGHGRIVTKEKETEKKLKESEEKFRSVVKSMDDIIFVIDKENRFVSVYTGQQNLLLKPEMFIGKKHSDIMPKDADNQYNNAIVNVKKGKVEEYEYSLEISKKIRWFSLKLSPILDNDKFTGSVSVVRDITERKENEQILQEQRFQVEKMNMHLKDLVLEEVDKSRAKDRMMMVQSRQAAMGEMIGSIAHQWRQPLNEVGIYIQNLQDRFEQNELSTENLSSIIEKTMLKLEYLSQTIDDFRNFFRSDREKSKFSLTDSLKKALSLTEASFKNSFINIITNLKTKLYIDGYSNEFSQAILNILNNAKDVLIERKIKNPYIEVKLVKTNGKIVLTISDNAGGIDKKDIDKIFEPYFTTKNETTGTGLGLYISKTIIERNMNGKLSVKNIKNGAEFKIEFKHLVRVQNV